MRLKTSGSTECSGQSHLPGGQTGRAHQVPAGLDLHVLVVLCTDLTKLERGAHLTVQLVLLLQGQRRKRRRHKPFVWKTNGGLT